MTETLILVAIVAAALGLVAAVVFTLRTVQWGSTADERAAEMPGDVHLDPTSRAFVRMTRAVTIDAPPEVVWPWIAQIGRGAGWCSWDVLDNGRIPSARHIVSWIPDPEVGDASPIGVLRRVEPGFGLTWSVGDTPFLGSTTRLVTDTRLTAAGDGSRLVIRMSADARGGLPRLTLGLFRFIDSAMARRQLVGIRQRAERYGARASDPDRPETGARDQFQHYEVIYASGESAGRPGIEHARTWRRAAIDEGLVEHEPAG